MPHCAPARPLVGLLCAACAQTPRPAAEASCIVPEPSLAPPTNPDQAHCVAKRLGRQRKQCPPPHHSARPSRPPLTVYLAAPRGFCAGVDRAIQIVELALAKYGAPVYVRHEIVHNRFVVDSLKAKGAVFVEELDDIPETDQPVIFSAHGVAKAVPAAAKARNMFVLDATCPLVFKVHIEAARHHEEGLQILLIGHAGHPEVVGTMGQLPEGAVTLIETAADAACASSRAIRRKLAFVTQTTLSVDDTAAIVAVLREPLPGHRRPAQGRHLLRDDQPPGGRQGHRAEDRLPARRRQPAELQLAAPRRGGASAPAARPRVSSRAPATSRGPRSRASTASA